MKTRKIALALGLFLGLAGLSFGDSFFSLALGYYRLSDQFPQEEFGRSQNAAVFNLACYYFPAKQIPLGLFVKTSIGAFGSGYEWKGDDQIKSLADYNGVNRDIRLCIAPSFKFKLGEKVHIPISFGPSFGFYWEENDSSLYSYYTDESFYYEALNFGIMGDIALIFVPSRRFFLKQGLSLEFDFLHAERGEMKMNYRQTRNTRFRGASYLALGFTAYFGVGLRFE